MAIAIHQQATTKLRATCVGLGLLSLVLGLKSPTHENPTHEFSANEVPAHGGAASTSLRRFSFSQIQMGTKFTLTFYAEDEAVANTASQAAFARVEFLNSLLSDYDEESELSRLSASSPHPKPVAISKELMTVLSQAEQLSRRTEGAFDVTVGPIVRLWRRARRQNELPQPERLEAALSATGYRLLRLNQEQQTAEQQTAQLTAPNMRLDLGGIAKGYAADEALRVLRDHGITSALVDAGGDVVAADPPPGESGWRIAIAEPQMADDGNAQADDKAREDDAEAQQANPRYVRIANAAVAQSGDTFQFVELNGVRYSHIVDPRTGVGLTNQLAVTVIAPDGISADSLASALSVLGPEKGLALLEELEHTEGIFMSRPEQGRESEVHASSGWHEYEEAPDRK